MSENVSMEIYEADWDQRPPVIKFTKISAGYGSFVIKRHVSCSLCRFNTLTHILRSQTREYYIENTPQLLFK